ncbi:MULTISPECIES: hypothetical protein [Streptomyces]|uniref:Uncharacterized protein n=1 Tax=Streptomyces sp. 900129855 TaxID=3155129 RepID=A0ABV2ZW13_9ACTN
MHGSGPPGWWTALAIIAAVLGVIEWLRPPGPGECRTCKGRRGFHQTSYVNGRTTTWYECSDCRGTGKLRR